MAFQLSDEVAARDEVQRLINLGLVYTLVAKSTGAAKSHHYTLREAMQAKTRKTRVVLTRNLLIEKVLTDGKNKSIYPEPAQ